MNKFFGSEDELVASGNTFRWITHLSDCFGKNSRKNKKMSEREEDGNDGREN